MARIAYVNGRYVHHVEAMVHIEDRGYQFADGIYEYIAFYNRHLLDSQLHFKRLQRSLNELAIAPPMAPEALFLVARELIARNGRDDGGLYIQVTRGEAKRDHPFPKNVKPALTMTVCAAKFPKAHEVKDGVKVISYPENRWQRRDIKSVALLANVLAKQEATHRQTREAWLVGENGVVSEGAVSNAYIVTAAGELVTHPADHYILGGVTREVVLSIAKKAAISVVERAFTIKEAHRAAEAFLTSTSANVLPVVKLDDKLIGDGRVGAVTRKLQAAYNAHIFAQTGKIF